MTRRGLLSLVLALYPLVPAAADPLQLVQAIRLDVAGRIDHFAVDEKGQRLFVAALGNRSVEVIDLAQGARLRTLTGFGKPQGLAFVAASNRLYVADGDAGRVTALDGTTFAPLAQIDEMGDADNLRYDANAGRLYAGYGEGGIRMFDAHTAATVGEIKLPAHPEGFALAGDGKRLFANVPGAAMVAALDLERGAIAQRWSMGTARANFPLAVDDAGGRVFVATRRPPMLHVFDAGSGRPIAQMPIDADADDVFFDRESGSLYAICGSGSIDVVQREAPDRYRVAARISTRPGTRTGLYVPALHRLYVGVPRQAGQAAEVRVYAVTGR